MKKKFINVLLAIVAIIGFLQAVVSNGFLIFLAGFMVCYAAVLGLIKLNTDFIENY